MQIAKKCLLVLAIPLGIAACNQTEVRGPEGQRLTVVKPADVRLERGEAHTMTIRMDRDNISGDLTISVGRLPDGVEAVDQPLRTSEETTSIVLRAGGNAALVDNHVATLTVRAANGMEASEQFRITVTQ